MENIGVALITGAFTAACSAIYFTTLTGTREQRRRAKLLAKKLDKWIIISYTAACVVFGFHSLFLIKDFRAEQVQLKSTFYSLRSEVSNLRSQLEEQKVLPVEAAK